MTLGCKATTFLLNNHIMGYIFAVNFSHLLTKAFIKQKIEYYIRNVYKYQCFLIVEGKGKANFLFFFEPESLPSMNSLPLFT